MACGFWLRVNGVWTPLEGVQKQVGREAERPGNSWTSVGGVRHIQYARRAARSWSLDLGHAGPEAVAALAMAAQGDAGDVWLWDESSARANMVDPVALAARPGCPVTDCGGMPVVSLTQGPSAPTTTRDVALKANATVSSTPEEWPGIQLGTNVDSLVKVSIPPTPEGMSLAGASLVMPAPAGASGTVTAKAASNAWWEPDTSQTVGWWTSLPGGTTVGTGTISGGSVSIPLSGVAAFEGADMTVRLSMSGTPVSFPDRISATPPVLRLTYTLLAADRTFTQLLRPGTYWTGMWSNATAGATLGNMRVDLGSGPSDTPLLATAGTGWRFMSAPVTLPDPAEAQVTIYDSSAYLLAGLMLSNLDHPNVYLPPEKTPVRVRVDDPTLNLDWLYAGEQGQGQRSVTIREVGA